MSQHCAGMTLFGVDIPYIDLTITGDNHKTTYNIHVYIPSHVLFVFIYHHVKLPMEFFLTLSNLTLIIHLMSVWRVQENIYYIHFLQHKYIYRITFTKKESQSYDNFTLYTLKTKYLTQISCLVTTQYDYPLATTRLTSFTVIWHVNDTSCVGVFDTWKVSCQKGPVCHA